MMISLRNLKCVCLISSLFTSQACFAATLTTQQLTTTSSMTSTQQQTANQTSLNVVSTQNSLLALQAATITATPSSTLITSLKSSTSTLSDFNLMYGTLITATGIVSALDQTIVDAVTATTNYNQSAFLTTLSTSASLYRSLQANSTLSWQHGLLYGTVIRSTGSPTTTDRAILNGIVQTTGYGKAVYLSTVTNAATLYRSLQTNTTYRNNFNLLYGATVQSTGNATASDRTKLMASDAAGVSTYNSATFLTNLNFSADLFKAIQPSSGLRTSFNLFYSSTLVPVTGSPDASNRAGLVTAVSTPGYSQTTFIKNLAYAGSLYTALKADSTLLWYFNLIVPPPTGSLPEIVARRTTMMAIVTVSTYNQPVYLANITKAGTLFRAIQTNATYRTNFNTRYMANIQSTGGATAADGQKLMGVVGVSTYNQTTFIQSLTSAVPPPPPPTGNIFSPTAFWNTKLPATSTLDANSAGLISELIANTKIATPWIASDTYSTPIYKVTSATPKVPVSIVQNGTTLNWTALHAALQKGVPIPAGAVVSGGLDGHMTILDTTANRLYEFWQLKQVNGQWQASWGGIIDNYSTSNGIMPTVRNSAGGLEAWGATATGLPIAGGLITMADVQAGKINHVLAISIVRPKQTSFKSPAQRTDGFYTGANAIQEGQIFRFPSNIVINPAWPPLVRMIVEAGRDYGIVVRDTGGSVSFYAEDPRPYGLTSTYYDQYMGGRPLWSLFSDFPWSNLQALA